jgi:hypothetical protein
VIGLAQFDRESPETAPGAHLASSSCPTSVGRGVCVPSSAFHRRLPLHHRNR